MPAAAAVLLLAVLTVAVLRTMVVDAYAVVESGSFTLTSGNQTQPVQAGQRISPGEILETNHAAGGIALSDGSHVEISGESRLALERATDGVRLHLTKGSLIVKAAKQRGGRLYVETKDVTVSVIGTVFLVNAEEAGSRVAVIEGEVRVQQGADEKKLRPGEQVATSPLMEPRAVKEEIAWSRNAEEHLALLQQSAAPPGVVDPAPERFEVISIRPRPRAAQSGGARGGGGGAPVGNRCFPMTYSTDIGASILVLDPGRLRVTRTTAHALIAAAYGLNCDLPEAVTGVPEWARSDAYDIEATIPSGSPVYTRDDLLRGAAPQLQKMLQNLLNDRFKLSVRREIKEMPAYNLVIAKSAKWDCQTLPTCHGVRFSENQDPDAKPDPGPVHTLPTTNAPHTTLAVWANVAAVITERPVIDKTGLKGYYDIRIDYPDMPDRVPTPEEVRRRFIGGMQEQLGFKLEPTTAHVEVLVVEHVEKPSEN
jgi:uncharacterized protein (TIGR03435 family)